MTVLAVVMAVFVGAGLLPFYLVNVVGRRERWLRYEAAFADQTDGRTLTWFGAFDGTVGAITLWSRGGFNWLEVAPDDEHFHVRISSSLVSSIRALRPLSIPWTSLSACVVAPGGVLTESRLMFDFSERTSDALGAEDLGFGSSFQVVLIAADAWKANQKKVEPLVSRLDALAPVADKIRKT